MSQVRSSSPTPVLRRLRDILAHRESRRATKYALVGVLNVTIDFALYAALLGFGVGYVAAKTLSLLVATLNGYTWNRRWTFRAGAHGHSILGRYVLVQAVGLLLNLAILTVLVEGAGEPELIAQVIAIPIVCALTFLGNRLWTFGARMQVV